MTNLTARLKDDVSTPVAPSPFPVQPAPLGTLPPPAINPRRFRDRRNYEERMADPVRAARWRAQKRQWWREHRAKWPVKVLVAP
jgi:hypothetical protein